MTKLTFAQLEGALREMDPAPLTLTEDERRRAIATRDRILATPGVEPARLGADRNRRYRRRVLAAAAVAAIVAVTIPTAVGGGAAFASWTAIPEPLSRSDMNVAALTCQTALGTNDKDARALIGEKRGGWTYVLLEGPTGEGACLMPEDLVGAADNPVRKKGFFGTFHGDSPETPTPARDGIVENESMEGSISLPGRLPFTTRDGWFNWVSGSVGSDVTGVIVHPPVGPDVQATVSGGRFSAWWPAGEARGDNPGVGGGWTYTVILADGTSQQVS